jgi:hypothetical protein
MPLHLGKIAALIALLTIGAFVLWLTFGSWLTGESADQHPGEGWLMPPSTGGNHRLARLGQQEQRIGAQAA